MTRCIVFYRVSDQAGTVQPNTGVLVLEEDGETPIAQTLYAAASGSSVRANPLVTDANGLALAYCDAPQRAMVQVGTDDPVPIDIQPDPAGIATVNGGADITLTPPAASSLWKMKVTGSSSS